MKSANAIAFDYRPSHWLTVAIVIVALLAAVSIFLSGLPHWLRFACAIFAASCAGIALGRHWRPLARRALWHPGGHWRVSDVDGREYTAELSQGVARGAWIVLRLRRSDGRHFALILGPDNCDADTRRRLRVRLASVESQA